MNLFSSKEKALPYRYYYIPTLVLVILGILDSIYLTYTHYRNYTDIAFSSFCAISQSLNCDTVSQSPWSILLGIPLSVWGFFAYSLFFFILLSVRRKTESTLKIWSVLLILSSGFSISALYFAYISTTRIHSYCLLCILSYLVSFLLFLYCLVVRRRFSVSFFFSDILNGFRSIFQISFLRTSIFILSLFFFSTIIFLPKYWKYQIPAQYESLFHGVTSDGHPWVGAQNPVLTIEEYTDYQCFQCYKSHFQIRKLINSYPDKIRLIHRHYPIDHEFNPHVAPRPFHIGSGRLSMLAIAAQEQNKFWEINDILYSIMREKVTDVNINHLANELNLDLNKLIDDINSPITLKLLENDIKSGLRHEVSGTPTYVIDNAVYEGFIPFEIIKEISTTD